MLIMIMIPFASKYVKNPLIFSLSLFSMFLLPSMCLSFSGLATTTHAIKVMVLTLLL